MFGQTSLLIVWDKYVANLCTLAQCLIILTYYRMEKCKDRQDDAIIVGFQQTNRLHVRQGN